MMEGSTIQVDIDASEQFGMTRRQTLHVPLDIPVDDAYFWTHHWQEAERSADKDIENGDFETFSNAADTITWLHADD